VTSCALVAVCLGHGCRSGRCRLGCSAHRGCLNDCDLLDGLSSWGWSHIGNFSFALDRGRADLAELGQYAGLAHGGDVAALLACSDSVVRNPRIGRLALCDCNTETRDGGRAGDPARQFGKFTPK